MVKAKACQPETLRARRREVEREPQEFEYARLRAELRRTWEKNTVWRCVVLARCCLSTCALRVSAQGFVDCAFWSRVCGYHAPRTTVGAYSKRRTISGVQRDCMVSTPAIQASQPSSPRALVHSQQVALTRAQDAAAELELSCDPSTTQLECPS